MSMIFWESLFGITASILLALMLSCRTTLYGLLSLWASRIRNTHFRWCFSVKCMTGLAAGVVSLIVVFTMFAYALLFCISLSFLSFCYFCAMASFLTGQKGASVRWKFCPRGQLIYRFSTAWQYLWVWPTWAHSLQMIWVALQSLEIWSSNL